jgi:hypothetical protein
VGISFLLLLLLLLILLKNGFKIVSVGLDDDFMLFKANAVVELVAMPKRLAAAAAPDD